MKNHGRVRSATKPEAIRVDEHHVWVHSNIIPINETAGGEDGDSGGFEGFEFNMVQYSLYEWVQFMSASLFDVADTVDTTAAVASLDIATIEAGGIKLAMVDPKTNIGKQMESRLQMLESQFVRTE